MNSKRLLKDVVDIIKNPLDDNGIFYKHDEENMKHAYALVIGPEDTIYNYGYYMFELYFPDDYPFSPPKVKYKTNNHDIRFNPNLYRNGKVCLSILNTWKGEQWTSCQTIRTVLLTLVTLFHNKPLLNEPGITESYKYFQAYNEVIQYSNYNIAIKEVMENKIEPKIKKIFNDVIIDKFKSNFEKIMKNLEILKIANPKPYEPYVPIYGKMHCLVDYEKMFCEFIELSKYAKSEENLEISEQKN